MNIVISEINRIKYTSPLIIIYDGNDFHVNSPTGWFIIPNDLAMMIANELMDYVNGKLSFQHTDHSIKCVKHYALTFSFYYPMHIFIGEQKVYTVGYEDNVPLNTPTSIPWFMAPDLIFSIKFANRINL